MKLLAALGIFLLSGIVGAKPLHNMVIFGDSLSDNGNLYEFMKRQLPPSPPYYKGRFSNGPVWIEHLISSYYPDHPEGRLLDYAYGGAGVSEDDSDDALFTLSKEINNYLLNHRDQASEDSLFIIWIGANNYLASPADMEKMLQEVNEGIEHSIDKLVAKGAKHILVVNLPNLGRTPAATEFGLVPEMTYMAQEHNQRLSRSIEYFKKKYPGVEWLSYDLYQTFEEVTEHPREYGFTNITDTCAHSEITEKTRSSVLRMVSHTKMNQDACEGYLFFDLVHPTGLAHQILGEKARIMLDQAGVEFSK